MCTCRSCTNIGSYISHENPFLSHAAQSEKMARIKDVHYMGEDDILKDFARYAG